MERKTKSKELRTEKKVKIPFCHSTKDKKSQNFKKLSKERLKHEALPRTSRVQLEIYDNLLFSYLFIREVREKGERRRRKTRN